MGIKTFDQTGAFNQAKAIFSLPGRTPQIKVTGTIHTPNKDILFSPVLRYRVTANFESEYAKKHRLLVAVGKGDYVNFISPNRDECLVTLTIEVNDTPLTLSRYRAGVYEKGDYEAETGDGGGGDIDQMNQSGFHVFSIQIADPFTERMRDRTIANTPINTNMESLLQVFYAPERCSGWGSAPTIGLPTKQEVFEKDYEGEIGVDVVPPSNPETAEAYLFPKGITLPGLVPFLQREYGIYMEGAGRFHDRGMWYIYPLYNLTRQKEEEQTLTVINVPKGRLPKVERSYRVKDRNVYILANDNVKVIDHRSEEAARHGNGVRYWNAARVQDEFAWRTGGELFFDLSDNLVSRSVKERSDDLNHYLKEIRTSSANHCVEFSRIAPLQGKYIKIHWQDSNPDLIYPAMPISYLYASGDIYKEYTGTTLGIVTEYTKVNSNNPKDHLFSRDSTLTVFVGDANEV